MFDDDDDHQETILPPTSTLFIVGDDEGREVFATRIAPTGTAVWTDQRFAGQSHYEGMKDLMTAFLDERLRSAGLDETSGGFTAEPGVFALQHGINGDHLDEPLGNLVERWHGILREEIGSLGIPGKALGPMHRLTPHPRAGTVGADGPGAGPGSPGSGVATGALLGPGGHTAWERAA